MRVIPAWIELLGRHAASARQGNVMHRSHSDFHAPLIGSSGPSEGRLIGRNRDYAPQDGEA